MIFHHTIRIRTHGRGREGRTEDCCSLHRVVRENNERKEKKKKNDHPTRRKCTFARAAECATLAYLPIGVTHT